MEITIWCTQFCISKNLKGRSQKIGLTINTKKAPFPITLTWTILSKKAVSNGTLFMIHWLLSSLKDISIELISFSLWCTYLISCYMIFLVSKSKFLFIQKDFHILRIMRHILKVISFSFYTPYKCNSYK